MTDLVYPQGEVPLLSQSEAERPLHPEKDGREVSEGRYWTMEEIEEHLGKSVFTPNFEGEFGRIRKMLEALL